VKRGLTIAVVAAVAVTAAIGASARDGATPPKKRSPSQIRTLVNRAIVLEKLALNQLDRKKLDDARRNLEKSRDILRSAAGSASLNPKLRSVGGNLRQAAAKDEIALDNLGKKRPPRDPRLNINLALVLKDQAVDKINRTAPPAKPANRPPAVTKFEATFARPTTTYVVTATDPDRDTLSYTWKKSRACGEQKADGAKYDWIHPDDDEDPDACPEEPIHAGTITVVVGDGRFDCTVVYRGGSAPTNGPIDPKNPPLKDPSKPAGTDNPPILSVACAKR